MPFNGNSFPKNEKLKTETEFQKVYQGKRVFGRLFIVYYILPDHETGKKVGFAVSKKVNKLAVKRNKLKRRLRELYRLNKALLPQNINFIIRAMPEADSADFYRIKSEIIEIFSAIAANKFSHRINQSL